MNTMTLDCGPELAVALGRREAELESEVRLASALKLFDELNAGRRVYGGSDSLFHAAWLETADDPPEMVLRKELGAGETAVIALALKIKADLVGFGFLIR